MLNLAAGDKPPFEFNGKIFDDAAAMVYDAGGFDLSQIKDPRAKKMAEETLRVIMRAVETGVPHEVPPELLYALEENSFVFSGFKTYHTLRDIGLSMVDDKGNVKPFEAFKEDVKKVNERYNINYLYAEYKHAVGASLMAVKWRDLAERPERYFLQYRTAGDSKVRETHRRLDGVTLPATDPFWDKYYPPNGWGCRCQVTKVRRGKYSSTDPKQAMKDGDEMTDDIKQRIFRYNAGKDLKLFPPKHPYYKAPAAAKKAIKELTEEQKKDKRVAEMRAQLPDTLTDAEKDAKAVNNYEIEKTLGITMGKPMTVEQADKQNANPHRVEEFILDPKGLYVDKKGNKYRKNPDYNKHRDEPFTINCQTCTPAYALRLMGFDITAKGNTKGSKLEFLSWGFNAWSVWKNIDGTPAKHTTVNSFLDSHKFKQMTPKRWMQFFDETCKEEGVYALSIGWKGKGGHMTVLQRFKDGELRYIEPQHDNSKGSANEWNDINELASKGGTTQHDCRGIMRIDNKLFNTECLEIFGV